MNQSLVEAWSQLAMSVEWVCHVGLGRFFAPWHAEACTEYEDECARLAVLIERLGESGALRPERIAVLRAAVAAHNEPFLPNATLREVRARDQLLRRAAEPPRRFASRVHTRVPEPRWPPGEFVAPPPVPTSSWREAESSTGRAETNPLSRST